MRVAPRTVHAVAGLALLAGGCAMFQSQEDSLREAVVDAALDQVGEDYRYGGASPDAGFDCSGLVHYSYAQAGLKLPRSAPAQRTGGRPIKFADAKAGDLLFYRFNDRKPGDLHVAIYLGGDQAVHAPVRDGEVEEIDISATHWRKRYAGATRYIPSD
jgi:cell wall-associated NlpC family hydrolase